jgi:hypothetical protein
MWEDKARMKKQMQEHLNKMPMARMKNFDGSKGMASFNNNEYKLVVDKSNELFLFESIDALSNAGWTID